MIGKIHNDRIIIADIIFLQGIHFQKAYHFEAIGLYAKRGNDIIAINIFIFFESKYMVGSIAIVPLITHIIACKSCWNIKGVGNIGMVFIYNFIKPSAKN